MIGMARSTMACANCRNFYKIKFNRKCTIYHCSTCECYSSRYNNNNNNTSQCGSHFRGVWEDPTVGNLTSTGIPTRREADSKRSTKK